MMLPSCWIASLGGVKSSLFFIAANKLFQFHLSPPSTSEAQASTSSFDGRTMYIPLMAEDPPRTFPRGHEMARLLACGCCTVLYAQS